MAMSEAVITAIIMAVSSIVCQILINRSNREKRAKEDLEKETKRAAEEAKKEAKLEDRLASIETKLDEHNGYAQKLGGIQTDIAVIKNDIKHLREKDG